MLKQSLLLHVFHKKKKKVLFKVLGLYISFDATQSLMWNGFVHTRFFLGTISLVHVYLQCCLRTPAAGLKQLTEVSKRSLIIIFQLYFFRLKKREEGLRFCELFRTVFVTYSDNHIFLPTICLNSIFVLFLMRRQCKNTHIHRYMYACQH